MYLKHYDKYYGNECIEQLMIPKSIKKGTKGLVPMRSDWGRYFSS